MKNKLRIGNGYDIHRLEPNRKLILGGVEIPNPRGLLGHSDADVLLHSIMDAILGAAAMGDIGQHFPPDDPAYKNISSLELLTRVNELIKENFRISNIDSTIMAEKPKLNKHLLNMRVNISKTLDMEIKNVSIKATTMEGLGPIGEGRAIAASAVVLLED